jgi:hypothetical protein
MISVAPNREKRRTLRGGAHHRGFLDDWQPRNRSVSLNPGAKKKKPCLPPTSQLLAEGGDSRIVCDPKGLNRYGCAVVPDRDVLAFGSSTASTISFAGFAAADALRNRLESRSRFETPDVTYSRELDRLRRELIALCGLESLSNLEIAFGASGTDLHLFASQFMVNGSAPAPLIIRVEAAETGKGVPDALAGQHFSDCAALGDIVASGVRLDCGRPIEIAEVKCRTAEGNLRPIDDVDSAVTEAVFRAAERGRRVLITLVDVSKTGLLAPSPACAVALQRRFPQLVEVLVDACQFRFASATLKAYLEHDFFVAITGSKFVTGPTFCGALFIPEGAAHRLRTQKLPRALKSYSTQADWPSSWAARDSLGSVANYGLLLRWEAALTELRAFRQLSDTAIAAFLTSFQESISDYLANHPAFELLPLPMIDRAPIASAKNWDHLPTIFSFLLRRPSRDGKLAWLDQKETKRVHDLLREDVEEAAGVASNGLLSFRCQLGQPVACGTREGVPVSALRLCLSTRLIVDALSPKGRGAQAVVADALAALDKTALLAELSLT